MLLIGSLSAMWAWWGKQFHEPKCGSGHVCRVMAWTRQQGLVPYIDFEKVRGDLCGRCHTCWRGSRWKSQNRKIVPLSLCRRTFKLEGNKKVRTWTEKSLRVFRISRSYVLCIYVMNVPCTFRIFVYTAMVHNCMSTHVRLFYASELWNRVHLYLHIH